MSNSQHLVRKDIGPYTGFVEGEVDIAELLVVLQKLQADAKTYGWERVKLCACSGMEPGDEVEFAFSAERYETRAEEKERVEWERVRDLHCQIAVRDEALSWLRKAAAHVSREEVLALLDEEKKAAT